MMKIHGNSQAIIFEREGERARLISQSMSIIPAILLDIIINFRTAYKNEEDETIVVDLKKIAHRYVCGFRSGGGWFFVDLISSLPIQYIALIGGGDEGKESGVQIKLFKVLRLLRLARLLRLIRIRALTRQYEDTALFDAFESLKLVHMTFLIVWMAHIAACVW